MATKEEYRVKFEPRFFEIGATSALEHHQDPAFRHHQPHGDKLILAVHHHRQNRMKKDLDLDLDFSADDAPTASAPRKKAAGCVSTARWACPRPPRWPK